MNLEDSLCETLKETVELEKKSRNRPLGILLKIVNVLTFRYQYPYLTDINFCHICFSFIFSKINFYRK